MYVLILVGFLADETEEGVGGSCLVGCSTLVVLYGVVDIAILVVQSIATRSNVPNMRKSHKLSRVSFSGTKKSTNTKTP